MKIQKQPDYYIFADSAKNGEIEVFPDVNRGWGITIDRTGSKPPLEWMNGAFNRVDKNILYLLQQGVPEWSTNVIYPTNAIIKYNGILYTATTENENSNPKTSSKWRETIDRVSNATTTQAGVVTLSSAVDSNSETTAATSLAIKRVNDGAVKKSGDTLTGQLTLSQHGVKLPFDNGNSIALKISNDQYSHIFYNSATQQRTNILAYNPTKNEWNFQSINDVTINGKSVLKTGDYGIGSLTGAPITNANDRLPSGWYATKTSNYPDLSGDDSAALIVYSTENKNYSIEKIISIASKIPVERIRCRTPDGAQSWYENITTANINRYLPVGVPIPYPSTTVPNGFLKCNGWEFDRTAYPELAKMYPSGYLPDLRGVFLRGLDDGRGIDNGRQILSYQGDASRKIWGEISPISESFGAEPVATGAFSYFEKYSDHSPSSIDRDIACGVYFDSSRVVPTADENRPHSVAFLYIVRAA
jgi:Phage Tail Collar Domain./Phage tail fibre repeat./Carbohydrate binding domain.